MGDHAESIEIVFDPRVLTYEKLVELFWTSHNPCSAPWSRQYMSGLFYHDQRQKEIALRGRDRVAKKRGKLFTEIAPAERFFPAEDYHQKYQLRYKAKLLAELTAVYPTTEALLESTAAARINGYLGGHGKRADFERELPDLGLSKSAQNHLVALVSKSLAQ